MRVLVIGGTGFIGSHVTAQLARAGHDVIVFHRGVRTTALPQGVKRIAGDRQRLEEHRDTMIRSKPEVVVDMILSSGRQAVGLMDTFRGAARRVVAASSIDVYRACGVLHGLEAGPLEPLPLTEDSALRTRLYPYSPDRVKALQSVFTWLDDEYDKIPVERAVMTVPDLPATVLRLPMVYGAGDPLQRVETLVGQMKGRTAIELEENRAAWRSPRGYVENVAAAIALAATTEAAAGRIYNVAEPDALSELEWGREVARACDWKGQFVVVPSDRAAAHLKVPGNFDQHWIADTQRIRRELGYTESVPRAEAIRRTIADILPAF